MKKLVKYTVYFWYEDDFWDSAGDESGSGSDHMDYFIEEHNCHTNFINDLQKSMELAGDDICGAGETKVIQPFQVPKDIQPYEMSKIIGKRNEAEQRKYIKSVTEA